MKNSVADFRKLHVNNTPLILPLAWDAASARLFENAGARAIATSSAAVSWALGYADGNNVSFSKLLSLSENVLRVISLPLSVDVEGGYSNDPEIVAQNIQQLVDLGISGINIEDNTGSFDLLLDKIRAIRKILGEKDLFINFRTDVYLQSLVDAEQQVQETIRRGKAAKDAGADGLFVPGLTDADAIKTIASQVELPVHVMAWPGLADATELGKLGVKRLSDGARIASVAWKFVTETAEHFIRTGASEPLNNGSWKLQELLSH